MPCRNKPPDWRLPERDELTIASVLLLALVSMAGWWLYQGGLAGRLIEIDAQPRSSPRWVVDLNTADWPEIAQLPGIGETIARRIVEARAEHGQWLSVDELRDVKGIGAKTLERLRPFVTVEPMPHGPRPDESTATRSTL
ncbi:MAG TPA: helix-hairpin-helix domain-containing protein [Pirellulales bacterium]|nr:helix-hairpin-helix domain-containing protein [Pirellulales bacterium]